MVSVLQEFIHAFISSMTSLEENQLIDTTKDSGGARVIEAFLSSDASGKQKRKLVVKYVLIFYFQWKIQLSFLILMFDVIIFFFQD